ncbi:hypothetical protein C8J56DRAFT_1157527 [Mycena floridula]|nr:hypothetical protein C8J56DRAFT_1157527 [Mycena floridula]
MDALAAEEAAIEAEMAKFDEPARKAIDAAVAWYNSNLFTQDAFPTSEMAKEWAIHALQRLKRPARMGQEEPVDITPVPLVQRQGLLYLEHGKNELRSLVIGRYHLSPQAEQAAQSALVTNLLQDSTFLHKDGAKFRAPIVRDAFEILDKRLHLALNGDEAYVPPTDTFFQTIAFVATALECCLDEWKSGHRVDLTFNADSYEGRYRDHFKNILPLVRHKELALWTF